jgi:cellulose synthase/poly-beta-1,6-N-acetylglucosamine synthase-like glycosyltransferase
MWWLGLIFSIFLLTLAIPVIVFFVQIITSLFARKAPVAVAIPRPRLAVLVPAHNEGACILPTLHNLKQQLASGDQLIVIADNCTDDTAAHATAAGATVIVRDDDRRRGKGYALDFGVRFLERQDAPEVVVIVDADCLLHAKTLDILATQALEKNRPVQALYLMSSPEGAGLKAQIAEFAWEVKNHARALGYRALGLPCQLMGTGMAFPWELIAQANIASGHIVEDLKLGLDFAEQRKPPFFCPQAVVTSVFPLNTEGMQTQRTRWEHGHLGMIVKEGPAMIVRGISGFNVGLLALALDMCVPPLALLTLFAAALAFISMILALITGTLMPWGLGILLFVLLALAVMIAWVGYGRHILAFSSLAYAPVYALAKIPLYLKFLIKRQVSWVRSRRD